MFRRFAIHIAAPLAWLALLPVLAAAEPAREAMIPQDAILVLDVVQPKPVLDLATHPKMLEAVTALPAYKKAAEGPKWREFRGGVAFLEARFGLKWPEALHKLLDGGVSLSVHPHEGVLVIADGKDEKLLGQLHDVFLGIARAEASKAGQPDRAKSKEYQGQTIWTFAPGETHAVIGGRLVLSNRPALLQQALDLRAKPGDTLGTLAAYQAAKKPAAGAVARAFVNLQVIKQTPDLQKALAKQENPLGALLFAAVIDALRGADALGLTLELHANTLVINASLDGKPADAPAASAFALPHEPGAEALPNLAVPRFIAGLSLYRDLHAFYAAKDQLFPERTSGLIFFENMMGIFFTGRDLTDEVLAETRPETRIVVAAQKYDAAVGAPRVQLPAFAVVFRASHPDKIADMTEEAWQKALGLVNFTRGQKAEPGLIIDRETYNDVRMTVAYFGKPGEKEKGQVDTRFNFRPTLARVGDSVVLSSTDGLAKDLIDALKRETKSDAATGATKTRVPHSRLEVDVTQLAAALQANHELLVRNTMVEKGKTRAQAESELDVLIGTLERLGRAKLEFGQTAGRHEAHLEVPVKLP